MVKNFDTASLLYEQSIQTKRDKTADFVRRKLRYAEYSLPSPKNGAACANRFASDKSPDGHTVASQNYRLKVLIECEAKL